MAGAKSSKGKGAATGDSSDAEESAKVADTGAVFVRFGPTLLKAIDTWVKKLNADGMGRKWKRTDVIRETMARAIRERGAKGEQP